MERGILLLEGTRAVATSLAGPPPPTTANARVKNRIKEMIMGLIRLFIID